MNAKEKVKQQRIVDAEKARSERQSAFSNPKIGYPLLVAFLLLLAVTLPPLF